MASKYVRFNYFEPQLVLAETLLKEEYEDDEKEFEGREHYADPWDMREFLDFVMSKRDSFKTTVNIGNEYSEIEKDSYHYDTKRDIYSFQLSKLRETNIPSKKKIGEIKEKILLQKDEFIGEFNSFVYDNKYGVVVMQSNLYGLSVAQSEHVLTTLRFRYLDFIGETDDVPLVVKLAPLIDRSKIERVAKADYYKKIKIKGSDFMLDANIDKDSLVSETRRLLYDSSGLNIDVTISMGRSERTKSLDQEKIREVIEHFNSLPEGKRPQIEISSLYNEESDVETINLIEPRMTDRVLIHVKPRQTVAHEYLLNSFLEHFDKRRPDIRRVVVPIE